MLKVKNLQLLNTIMSKWGIPVYVVWIKRLKEKFVVIGG